MSKKIIPSFSYCLSIETSDQQRSLLAIKNRLLKRGGSLISESDSKVEIEIAAAMLATAFNFYPNMLIVNIMINGKSGLKIEVTRTSDKTAGIVFLLFATAICIVSYLQKRELQALAIPFILYGVLWIHSILHVHPANKELRKLITFSDE